MEKTKLLQEHKMLKGHLAEIIDYINSEEFFNADLSKKTLAITKRSSLETYVNALSCELWGNDSMQVPNNAFSSILPTALLSMMFSSQQTPITGSSAPCSSF